VVTAAAADRGVSVEELASEALQAYLVKAARRQWIRSVALVVDAGSLVAAGPPATKP